MSNPTPKDIPPRPKGVTVDREQAEVIIKWNDGQECRYPFDGLRAICPCVGCKGGHANMGGPPDLDLLRNTPPTGLTIDQVQAVGTYAIQFYWSDGHWTGIYTWSYLKQACG
jgi:DUF971 family protein